MKLVTGPEMADIDRRAREEYGIPGIVLMENAGLQVLEAALSLLEQGGTRITILCGPGNNGGDGLVVARHLINAGYRVFTYLMGDRDRLTGDALTNYIILTRMGHEPQPLTTEEDLNEAAFYVLTSDLIIDGLYGTGFKGRLNGLASQIVSVVNQSGRKVLAIDIPSGLDSITGRAEGGAVRANWTVTMALPKIGLLTEAAAGYVGRLTVADISMPRELLTDPALTVNLVTEDMVRAYFGTRPRDSHKGDYGHVLIIGGSPGMTGAPAMASRAALRGGAGLVTAAVPASLLPLVAAQIAEAMTYPLPETGGHRTSPAAFSELQPLLKRVAVAVVGPGLSVYEDGKELITGLIKGAQVPLVLDADALNLLSGEGEVLASSPVPLVLTPHPGEMARLTGLTVPEVQEDRLAVASKFAREWNVILVLKGYQTVTALPDGQVYINLTGNPGMATGGSGDVLAGLIGSLIAQGLPPEAAAYAGVYVHGRAGDLAAREKGERGLTALDIAEAIPRVFKDWES